ncbi:hypothetical protein DC74_1878 [Streptomyces noursei]|uniref:Uncharacterized protein n=1 Tax=Streptomyces noursei TaxID=1971 RepID=A0A059W3H2_STRNR|nr:hypothetical protein DC74_1878 [Streptomyces noursei]GCB90015.1 hypothetical protein SALB_02709 [Streptomyces noursei]
MISLPVRSWKTSNLEPRMSFIKSLIARIFGRKKSKKPDASIYPMF